MKVKVIKPAQKVGVTQSFRVHLAKNYTIKTVSIVTPDVASALGRVKVSDRNATYILAPVAKSLECDPSQKALNKDSVWQARRKHREAMAAQIKEAFAIDGPTASLTVHYYYYIIICTFIKRHFS